MGFVTSLHACSMWHQIDEFCTHHSRMEEGAFEEVSSFMGLPLEARAGTMAFILRGPLVPMTLYWNSTAAVSERLPSSAGVCSKLGTHCWPEMLTAGLPAGKHGSLQTGRLSF